jgi:hypothetical protein
MKQLMTLVRDPASLRLLALLVSLVLAACQNNDGGGGGGY